MKLALVAPLVTPIAQPYTGGAQALLADLAQGLLQRGHEVTLFARAGSFVPQVPTEQIIVPESVLPASFSQPVQERSADPGFFAQANLFLELFLQLRHRSFDLVHAHAFDWPAYACSTILTKVPIVHTVHLPAVSPEINAALRVLDQHGHPLTLVTVSQACARTYANYTPFDAIIYNGLDLRAIPFVAQNSTGAPLLYAGRIAPEKGVEAAINIAARAGQRLLIAGSVYDRDYYEQRIEPEIQRAREHGADITYLGSLEREALWEVMGRTLGVLCPIEWDEPFGLVPVEAQATGTPVIAYRRGALPEVIRDGETGFLVTPGALDEAASLVDKLPMLSRARCRANVEQQFSLEHMLDEYESVYQQYWHKGVIANPLE